MQIFGQPEPLRDSGSKNLPFSNIFLKIRIFENLKNIISYIFTSANFWPTWAFTWFRIEKSGFFQYCPQNPHFWTFKKYNHIYFYKCKFLANLSLCGPGGFPHKCLLRFYLIVFHHFINKNNWKLVLIITFRNRRFAKFCKKRRPQLPQIFII